MLVLRSNRNALRVAHAKVSLPERRAASNACAIAVLGGRFQTVPEAMRHPDFADATRSLADKAFAAMKDEPDAKAAAIAVEVDRRRSEHATSSGERIRSLDLEKKGDAEYVQERFGELCELAEAGTAFPSAELSAWRQLFSASGKEVRRAMCYQFQFSFWAGIVDRTPADKHARGNAAVRARAVEIFGEDVAWCEKKIATDVKAGESTAKDGRGAPRSFPKEIEDVLLLLVDKLRQCKVPVYKATVLDRAMDLLSDHQASLNFAKVEDGDYVRDETGHLIFDPVKLDHWYYRRFLGDHEELRTGNQRILDSARTKWYTSANMRPHYDTLINACTSLVGSTPIGYLNPNYDPEDRDADGVPKQPEMLYHAGQEHRVVSFDEMKADDKTHGDGNRKGRTERSIRYGAGDDGECVGTMHASRPMSAVGGANGAGDALPLMVVTASKTFEPNWCKYGPTTTVKGRVLKMHGTCNEKGSVKGAEAIEFVKKCVLPVFEARGGLPTAECKGVLVCDGVGSHLCDEFIEFLLANHLVLVLRTPYCSSKQQPEDIHTFWVVKNAADVGFYKAKQAALLKHMREHGSGALPWETLIRVLAPAWENGLSTHANEVAWRKAGISERGGITSRPYWVALAAEQGAPKRKTATAEARARAIATFGLGVAANLDALRAPWEKQTGAVATTLTLTDETVAAAAEEEAEGSGRLLPSELAQMGVPATDGAMLKYREFKGDLSHIKKMSAAELKEELAEMRKEMPAVPAYTNALAAKATLIRALEATYSSTPTCADDGKEVNISWKVRKSWLPADLQQLLFPPPPPEDAAPEPQKQEKKRRKLGSGAYQCTGALPIAGPLLVLSPGRAQQPRAAPPPLLLGPGAAENAALQPGLPPAVRVLPLNLPTPGPAASPSGRRPDMGRGSVNLLRADLSAARPNMPIAHGAASFPPGALARLIGLQDYAELNGAQVKIIKYLTSRERYVVDFPGGERERPVTVAPHRLIPERDSTPREFVISLSDDEQREFMRDVRLGSSVNQHAYPNIHIALEPPLPPPHALQACTPPPVRVARHVVKNARFCIFKRRRSFRLGAGSAGAAEAYRLKCTSRALRWELCARE